MYSYSPDDFFLFSKRQVGRAMANETSGQNNMSQGINLFSHFYTFVFLFLLTII